MGKGSKAGQVLLVDDEERILGTYKMTLQNDGIPEVLALSDSRRVLPLLAAEPVAVLVLDLSMPHVSGLEILASTVHDFPHIPVVVVTANDEIQTVVQCMKLGAFDYLTKPVEPGLLVSSVKKALEFCSLSTEISSLKERLLSGTLEHPAAFDAIVTCDPKMRALFQYAEVAAVTRQPILITGETGVGKELMARAIHELSGLSGPYVSLNVAGLDDAMFSDTLFGHKKGAYTGAEEARLGLIGRAAGGTLFLDEIGDLNEKSQVKLLRLLQEREYYQVGSDVPRKSDARIVLATNRDLQKRIAEGKFRNDLYYRLRTHLIDIPPLRERKEDLPLLLKHFIGEASEELRMAPPSYPKELLDLLSIYHFPGNVRELEGMVRDAVARSRSRILSQEPFRQAILGDQTHHPIPKDAPLDDEALHELLEAIWGHFPTLSEAEELLISTALKAAKGNQGIAATMLGLKRQTLNMRLKAKRTAQ